MYNSKYLMRVVSYFLPKYAEILEVGEEYKIPALIEGDIDKDGENEILALYKRNQNNYILILKLFGRKWYTIWNNRTHYRTINKFQLANLTPKYSQIALGGKIEEEEGYKLSLLNWKGESLQEMLSEPIPFDKLYIEDIDGEDGLDEIALWQHKVLEAYDIYLYRYKGGKLILDKSLEKKYFKIVVNYYEYLNQTDTEGSIYAQYLEQAKRKCELEYKIEDESKEKEGIADRVDVEYKPHQDSIEVRTAYLAGEEAEEDVYLWGKRQEEFITDMKLAITKNDKTSYEIMPIVEQKVYDYQLFVGDFTGNKLDDIWLGIKEDKTLDVMHVCIYSFRNGRLEIILDTHDLEQEQLGGEIVEIYPVDRELSSLYEVCYKTIEKQMIWLRWEEDVFVPYKQYDIQS